MSLIEERAISQRVRVSESQGFQATSERGFVDCWVKDRICDVVAVFAGRLLRTDTTADVIGGHPGLGCDQEGSSG
jgi:hypothetical protein